MRLSRDITRRYTRHRPRQRLLCTENIGANIQNCHELSARNQHIAIFKKKVSQKIWLYQKKRLPLQSQKCDGAIAQLVEQRTENPCVPGSIPGGTTRRRNCRDFFFFLYRATHTHITQNNRTDTYCRVPILPLPKRRKNYS